MSASLSAVASGFFLSILVFVGQSVSKLVAGLDLGCMACLPRSSGSSPRKSPLRQDTDFARVGVNTETDLSKPYYQGLRGRRQRMTAAQIEARKRCPMSCVCCFPFRIFQSLNTSKTRATAFNSGRREKPSRGIPDDRQAAAMTFTQIVR